MGGKQAIECFGSIVMAKETEGPRPRDIRGCMRAHYLLDGLPRRVNGALLAAALIPRLDYPLDLVTIHVGVQRVTKGKETKRTHTETN